MFWILIKYKIWYPIEKFMIRKKQDLHKYIKEFSDHKKLQIDIYLIFMLFEVFEFNNLS